MLEKWQYKDLLGHVSAKRVKTAPSIGYRGFNIPLFLSRRPIWLTHSEIMTEDFLFPH